MALDNVYKALFFLQSTAFLLFILYYFQQSDIIRAPAVMRKSPCICLHNHTRTIRMPPCKELLLRGRLSNCTWGDISSRPGVMLLTSTNLAFLDMTMNMLESIKRTRVCVNTTIIAEDEKVYEYLWKRAEGDPGVWVVKTSSGYINSKEILRRNPKQYYEMMNKRQAYILTYLEQGWEILFTDTDTFWFRDPFPFFEGNFDISLIDSANPFGVRNRQSNFCAGFVYFKPTSATLQFVQTWIQSMKTYGWMRSDQTVMNGLLYWDKPVHIDIKPLDTNIFPWGPKFYNLLAKKANYSTVVMHAASIRGHAAKVASFKSSNMWLINATSQELLHIS
ncbi:UDP-D-xylose:L-fucose alpha-1,3-D-xylosyltransferase-like [Acanthaster planci]|uniref:UDP-D-xylose:L-fucose alpha-1,3-D-xylosyltransferase-like n=1 Tax=Acanthaster planci TaxID=133434 RepID=A0A8B7ZV89_ACAPL|nr:UDP-D-xylose:L-fucose alpha-1,3-D-xylosyltransferase-like [Acanthaster planci]XP_022109335.1 UDP-D-xylose:L-fucose alpha-1,3-D-xylosyltransferase-like [Acanthaster planci]